MDIETHIIETVQDMLATDYGLSRRPRIVQEDACTTCGVKHEKHLDYLGDPNGYKTHNVGVCIENLRARIDRFQLRLIRSSVKTIDPVDEGD